MECESRSETLVSGSRRGQSGAVAGCTLRTAGRSTLARNARRATAAVAAPRGTTPLDLPLKNGR